MYDAIIIGAGTAGLTAAIYAVRSGKKVLVLETMTIGGQITLSLIHIYVALRCNLVTLSDDEPFESKTMVDYCAGDISSEEAAQIIKTVQEKLGNEVFSFYPGVSYRHCLVWKNGSVDIGTLTPPHDISRRVIGPYINADPRAAQLIDMMIKSGEILKDHPVNRKRIAEGKRPATHIWLWGQGKKAALDNFYEKTGLKGSVVSAVDLVKGIGRQPVGCLSPDCHFACQFQRANCNY